MNALLKKDLYNLEKQGKYLLLFFFLYGSMSFLSEQISFFCSFTTMMAAMLPLSSFSYDQYSKWNNFALTMPWKRSTIVCAKYAFSLICILSAVAIGLLITLISYVFMDVSVEENLFTLLLMFPATCIMLSILLPLIFKLGVEKARYAMLTIVMLPILLLFLLAKADPNLSLSFENPENLLLQIGFIGTAISFFFMGISCRISIVIFNKKEF